MNIKKIIIAALLIAIAILILVLIVVKVRQTLTGQPTEGGDSQHCLPPLDDEGNPIAGYNSTGNDTNGTIAGGSQTGC